LYFSHFSFFRKKKKKKGNFDSIVRTNRQPRQEEGETEIIHRSIFHAFFFGSASRHTKKKIKKDKKINSAPPVEKRGKFLDFVVSLRRIQDRGNRAVTRQNSFSCLYSPSKKKTTGKKKSPLLNSVVHPFFFFLQIDFPLSFRRYVTM
jgi:hypothetical protein